MIQQPTPEAHAYAAALAELAEENNAVEPVANDAGALREALSDNPEFADFLKNPSIEESEKQTVLDNALSDAHQLVKNFVGLMNSRGRLGILPETLEAFEVLLDEKLGKVEADLTVAQKLDDDALERVRSRVGKAFGRDAVVHQYVDPEIIGGLVLKVGDQVIDASVRRQLEAMRERLLK